MSNLGFFLMAEKNAIHMEKTKVGDRYVLERMKEIGASPRRRTVRSHYFPG